MGPYGLFSPECAILWVKKIIIVWPAEGSHTYYSLKYRTGQVYKLFLNINIVRFLKHVLFA